jgi:hypothetical protein
MYISSVSTFTRVWRERENEGEPKNSNAEAQESVQPIEAEKSVLEESKKWKRRAVEERIEDTRYTTT